jgi:FkbM family methyltransferase
MLSKLFITIKNIFYENDDDKSLQSYSQCGEDLIIKFIFYVLGNPNPSYVDIGAYHPKKFSNTFLFYDSGSTGVCIEPDPYLLKIYAKKRLRDICLNVGVGVGESKAADFFVFSVKTLNTFSEGEANKCIAYGQKLEKVIQVPLANINSILQQYFSDKAPNFISLDIEGLDFEVIQSFDFSKYRPEVFCIETLTYSEDKSERKIVDIIEYMKSQEYFVYADTYINTIFVDKNAWARRQ